MTEFWFSSVASRITERNLFQSSDKRVSEKNKLARCFGLWGCDKSFSSVLSMKLHLLCVVCARGATRDEHKDLDRLKNRCSMSAWIYCSGFNSMSRELTKASFLTKGSSNYQTTRTKILIAVIFSSRRTLFLIEFSLKKRVIKTLLRASLAVHSL